MLLFQYFRSVLHPIPLHFHVVLSTELGHKYYWFTPPRLSWFRNMYIANRYSTYCIMINFEKDKNKKLFKLIKHFQTTSQMWWMFIIFSAFFFCFLYFLKRSAKVTFFVVLRNLRNAVTTVFYVSITEHTLRSIALKKDDNLGI